MKVLTNTPPPLPLVVQFAQIIAGHQRRFSRLKSTVRSSAITPACDPNAGRGRAMGVRVATVISRPPTPIETELGCASRSALVSQPIYPTPVNAVTGATELR